MELGSVFQGLSAAASIVSAFKSAIDVRKELTRSDVEIITQNARQRSEAVYMQGIIAAQKIRGLSDSMIETIKDKIEQSRQKWKNNIDSEDTMSRWEQATDELKAECCALLRQMKKLNGGQLPSEWYELWSDMQCS
jgi:gas vesicle protein